MDSGERKLRGLVGGWWMLVVVCGQIKRANVQLYGKGLPPLHSIYTIDFTSTFAVPLLDYIIESMSNRVYVYSSCVAYMNYIKRSLNSILTRLYAMQLHLEIDKCAISMLMVFSSYYTYILILFHRDKLEMTSKVRQSLS